MRGLRIGCAVWWLAVVGCGRSPYGGPNCHSIGTKTDFASLSPVDGISPAPALGFKYSDPFIAGTDAVACCASNAWFSTSSSKCAEAVDCDALIARLRVASVGGKYVDEDCGPMHGVTLSCHVYLDEQDSIIGVQTFCAD